MMRGAESRLSRPLFVFALPRESAAFRKRLQRFGRLRRRWGKGEGAGSSRRRVWSFTPRSAKNDSTKSSSPSSTPSQLARLTDIPFDIVHTGPGPTGVVSALDAIEPVPSWVCQVGFAGATSNRFAVGDIVRLESVRHADDIVETTPRHASVLSSSASTPSCRIDALDLPAGRAVTVDHPVDAAEKRDLGARLGIDLVDMESFDVLTWCRDRDVSYVGVRTVSDAVEDALPPAVLASWDGTRFRLGRILTKTMTSPRAWFDLFRLARVTAELGERLAATLLGETRHAGDGS